MQHTKKNCKKVSADNENQSPIFATMCNMQQQITISHTTTTSNANKAKAKWAHEHLHAAADALHACGKQREMQQQ